MPCPGPAPLGSRQPRRSPPHPPPSDNHHHHHHHHHHHPSRCAHTAAECVANTCVLCVCCPLALIWRSLKFPCKIAWRAARRCLAVSSSCPPSGQHLIASYSSFSDIDEPDLGLRPTVKHLGGMTKIARRRCFSSSSESPSCAFDDSGLKSFIIENSRR